MTKILVAILTSGKPEKLGRCIQSVTNNSSLFERIVICNSNDENFINLASQISYDNNINFRTSVSNGTPGKGKNSVLDYFLTTDCDWLFQIDGDDYISEGCIARLYDEINSNDFDLGCLTNGYAVRPSGTIIALSQVDLLPKVMRHFLKYSEEERNYYINHKSFVQSKTFNGEPINRNILYNRNAASHRYNEELSVSEDVLFFLQSKEIFKIHEISASEDDFLYMYDFTDDGAVMTSIKNKTLIQNIELMMTEYNNGN